MGGVATLVVLATVLHPALVAATDPMDADLWLLAYDEIFGPYQDNLFLMSERQLMHSMTFLHNAGRTLDSISDEAKHRAMFWYDKAFNIESSDKKVENCKSDYLRSLAEVYERDNIGRNPNLQQVYVVSRRNIMQFCEGQYAAMLTDMGSRVPSDKLFNLLDIYTRNRLVPNVDITEALVGPVLNLIDVKNRASTREVIEAWNSGPCGIIISNLRNPNLKNYYDFVEMCKFDARDFRWHCSAALKKWVDLIEMCRDVDILMPYIAENVEAKRPQELLSWKKAFDEIFGVGQGQAPPMHERKILLSLMYLYANLDLRSADECDREVVKYWYNALVNFDIENCTVEYVQSVTGNFSQQIGATNPNYRYLYYTFRRNLVEFCDSHLDDLSTKFYIDVSDSRLSFLRPTIPGSQQDVASTSEGITDGYIAESLASSLIEMVEAGAKGEIVMDAWNSGPCGIIISTLNEPYMQRYVKFIQMSVLDRAHYLSYCSKINQVWIKTVNICMGINNWIPVYAQDNSVAPNLRKAIRALSNPATVEVIDLSDSDSLDTTRKKQKKERFVW